MQQPQTKTCPRCGSQFTCGPANGADHCWCAELPHIIEMNCDAGCWCPECLKQEIDQRMRARSTEAKPGE